MSSYSFDVIKKMAFEKEIEHIRSTGLYAKENKVSVYESELIEYLEYRIKEIEKEYGEPMVRD